jgi:hypothetical protein
MISCALLNSPWYNPDIVQGITYIGPLNPERIKPESLCYEFARDLNIANKVRNPYLNMKETICPKKKRDLSLSISTY